MSFKFEKAVAYVQGLEKGSGPDNDTKLKASYLYFEVKNYADWYGNEQFYKYYKQGSLTCSSCRNAETDFCWLATVGDADPKKEPSRFQFVERAKWWVKMTVDEVILIFCFVGLSGTTSRVCQRRTQRPTTWNNLSKFVMLLFRWFCIWTSLQYLKDKHPGETILKELENWVI